MKDPPHISIRAEKVVGGQLSLEEGRGDLLGLLVHLLTGFLELLVERGPRELLCGAVAWRGVWSVSWFVVWLVGSFVG